MITIKHQGGFDNTEKFLKGMVTSDYVRILDRYGKEGVTALASATPVDTGKTAASWGYEIQKTRYGAKIIWTNSEIIDGVPIAVLIQYGHATRNGGYVSGRDYINPALQPIFDRIAGDIWREVTNK